MSDANTLPPPSPAKSQPGGDIGLDLSGRMSKVDKIE